MKKDSKIYVAGHTGLVGSALVRKLSSDGYNAIITRTHSELDLTNQAAVSDFFFKEKPEYVFLAAAKVGGIIANSTYPADFIYQNIAIQTNVIYQSYQNHVKRLLFLGSSCIYPRECPQPIKEEYLLTSELEATNEPYALAKIAGLRMCESFNRQYGTNFISVMPTNLYGPNDNYDLENSHVLPALIRKFYLAKKMSEGDYEAIKADFSKHGIKINNKMIKGNLVESYFDSNDVLIKKLNDLGISDKSIVLWGSGMPRREFLHSIDLADACIFLMEKYDYDDLKRLSMKATGQDKKNIQVNIGCGYDVAIKELAAMLVKLSDYEGRVIWDDSKPDGTYQKLLSINKMKQLGWEAAIPLEKGVADVYANYSKGII